MKVIAINGSPHKSGNTAIMLNQVLDTVAKNNIDTELIQVGGTNIRPCRACRLCAQQKNKKCVTNDDVFNEIFEKVVEADAIVLGSPSYFSDMTPELKCFIDRAGFVALQNGGLFRRKIGVAVVAQRRGGGTHIQASIHHMFLMNEMVIPGSTYWNFGFGPQDGTVKNDEEAMRNMENLGNNIVWLLSKIR